MHVVSTNSELAAVCKRLGEAPYVAIDTEFMRESTFWPELCLVQMAGGGDEVLVDPIADGLDLAPFFELMARERVLKVFHAGRQDIEIVYMKSGIIPHPVFDTQIAAMVCGFGESVSFSNLVKKVVGTDVDKSSQFTDWKRRPLTPKQLTYALGDVIHLRPIYEYLKKELDRSDRSHWLEEEMADLTSPATYDLHPEQAWQRLKLRVKSRKALAVLMELAEWRERSAQRQNVPRSRILKDEAIYDLANQLPQSPEQLTGLRTIHDGFARSARGQEVLAAVKRGLGRDLKDLPPLERGEQIPGEAVAIMELLKVLLKAVAADLGVAPKIIATTEELEQIALNKAPDIPALKGWRRELFGEAALKLKSGLLALKIENGAVVTFEPARP